MSSDDPQVLERYEELLAGYVLGSLTPEEEREFHILAGRDLPPVAMTVEEARELLAELPTAVRGPKPSARVKRELLAQVERSSTPVRRSWFDPPHTVAGIPALAWAAILVLALINAGMFVQTFKLHRDYGRLARQNTELKKEISDVALLSKQLDRQKTLSAMLTRPDVMVAQLKGTKTDCSARIYCDPNARLVLVCTKSLPRLEPGEDYQLWALFDGKPMSIGVLGSPEDGVYQIRFAPSVPMEKNHTLAISKEPKGGQSQPTGEVVLASL